MDGSTLLKYSTFILAQCCGLIAFIIIITILSDCGGIDWSRYLNFHAFCMFMGMVYLQGMAISAFRVMSFVDRPIAKMTHMAINGSAIVLAIVALCAVLDSKTSFSLHGVIGIMTFSLFGLQLLVGFFSFMYPKLGNDMRAAIMPLHRAGGAIIFSMAVITAVLGISSYNTFIELTCFASNTIRSNYHAMIGAGVFTLLYGVFTVILVQTKFFKSDL